ncbi:hypothetical protein Gotur_007776 [Gossypium turneri]
MKLSIESCFVRRDLVWMRS